LERELLTAGCWSRSSCIAGQWETVRGTGPYRRRYSTLPSFIHSFSQSDCKAGFPSNATHATYARKDVINKRKKSTEARRQDAARGWALCRPTVASWQGGAGWRSSDHRIFACGKMFVFQKYKIRGWKSFILKVIKGKIKILSNHNVLCRKYAAVYRLSDYSNSLPSYYFLTV